MKIFVIHDPLPRHASASEFDSVTNIFSVLGKSVNGEERFPRSPNKIWLNISNETNLALKIWVAASPRGFKNTNKGIKAVNDGNGQRRESFLGGRGKNTDEWRQENVKERREFAELGMTFLL
ncbi:hypothetical protein L484_023867 [Morus notabilis]|uniref:Uncharacterized protein n=1 Tax=Morus notabilis TaxID=981085 RepID=W9RFU6_9ROSA|nr:hypothetical protein L484_023867 [Morus notabilis]